MNRPDLYQKTVDLLLDAYNNQTLKHGDCTACAVGNICGNNARWSYLFVTPSEKQYKESPDLVRVKNFNTGEEKTVNNNELEQFLNNNPGFSDSGNYHFVWSDVSPRDFISRKLEGIDLIKNTGYTIEELARIEFAFESSLRNTKEGYDFYTEQEPKKGQFIGLTAVLNVLAEIHETSKKENSVNQKKLEKVYEKVTA